MHVPPTSPPRLHFFFSSSTATLLALSLRCRCLFYCLRVWSFWSLCRPSFPLIEATFVWRIRWTSALHPAHSSRSESHLPSCLALYAASPSSHHSPAHCPPPRYSRFPPVSFHPSDPSSLSSPTISHPSSRTRLEQLSNLASPPGEAALLKVKPDYPSSSSPRRPSFQHRFLHCARSLQPSNSFQAPDSLSKPPAPARFLGNSWCT